MENQDLFTRYSRQIFIDEVGVLGQRKLLAAKVLVVGAGGLGSPVLQYLAAAGIGTLACIDFDVLELHNLNRQVIHQEKQVGKSKVKSAQDFIQGLNSSIQFVGLTEKLSAANALSILDPYDIIVDGSDNFDCRYIINDTCLLLQKPLVYGSIYGFEGQLAVFNYKGSKQLRDIFPEAPSEEDVPNCDRMGVLGPLPGMLGSMMAMEVIKIIIGLPVLQNQLTIIDSLNWQFNKLRY